MPNVNVITHVSTANIIADFFENFFVPWEPDTYKSINTYKGHKENRGFTRHYG